MNVIRHDDRDLEVELRPVVVQTAFEHDRAGASRKNPATIGAKRHKMLPVVDLQMRQLSSIKSLRHKDLCGDSRLRLSAERSSAVFDSRTAKAVSLEIFEKLERADSKLGTLFLARRRASLARTADGGCPHMVIPLALGLPDLLDSSSNLQRHRLLEVDSRDRVDLEFAVHSHSFLL